VDLCTQLSTQSSIEDKEAIQQLRRFNSGLSEDCERYMTEISTLSMKNDSLNEKITKHEEEIKVRL